MIGWNVRIQFKMVEEYFLEGVHPAYRGTSSRRFFPAPGGKILQNDELHIPRFLKKANQVFRE
jgi:hypothetical protein